MHVYMLYNRRVDYPIAVFDNGKTAMQAERDLNQRNPRSWYVRDQGVSSDYKL